jgi:hypothetical protein
MVTFSKDTLRHSCSWNTTEELSKTISGFPDAIILNINEGYEVLHFVCRYMVYKNWAAEATFQNLETALKTRLPINVKTHYEVKEWLDENFRR